jgi:hypothetical protein
MRQTLSLTAIAMALAALSGCASYRHMVYEVPSQYLTHENWSVFVWVRPVDVNAADGSAYRTCQVECYAKTGEGWEGPIRESAYVAHFDSLGLSYQHDGEVIELPLEDMVHSAWDDPSSVRLLSAHSITLPGKTRELRGVLRMTFTDKTSGQKETRGFEFRLSRTIKSGVYWHFFGV